MNSYKVVSTDDKVIVIDFVINDEKVRETLDIRYIPTSTAEALDAWCLDYMEAYARGKEVENKKIEVSEDIVAIKGKVQKVEKIEEDKEDIKVA